MITTITRQTGGMPGNLVKDGTGIVHNGHVSSASRGATLRLQSQLP